MASRGDGSVLDSRDADFVAECNRVLETRGIPCRAASSGGGFGMYASRRIARGELIATEVPLTLTVVHEARAHTCATCLADSRYGANAADAWERVCGSCGIARYCSAACQHAGSPRHCGRECAATAALAAGPPPSELAADLLLQSMCAAYSRILAYRRPQR